MPIMRLAQMMAASAEKAFRFTVVTTVPDETFGLPLELTGNYDFNANWGDDNSSDITVWNHADTIHQYATPGTHTISITGTIIGWRFNNGGDCALMYEVKSWGPLRLGNSNGYFYGCVNMTVTATDVLDLTLVTSLQDLFRLNYALTDVPSMNSWDTSAIQSFLRIFAEDALLENIDLNNLNTSSLTSIYHMFSGCTSVTEIGFSSWDVSLLVSATNFLQTVTLSTPNYNALILSWSPQVPSGAYNFHGGNSKYTTGGAVMDARDAWVAKGWILTDGGEDVGAELITDAGDRDFSAGQGNWVVDGGNDVTWADGVMKFACDEANIVKLTVGFDLATVYRVEYELTVYTLGLLNVTVGGSTYGGDLGVGVHVLYKAAGAGKDFKFSSFGLIGEVDNISIKKCL